MEKKLLSLFLFLLIFCFIANFVLAQRPLEVEYPEIGGYQPETVSTLLPEYVKYIFNFAIWIVGIAALGSLIYGGVLYLTSAGIPEKIKRARNQILASFLGILILLGSYFILYTINPQLVILKVQERVPVEIIPPEEFKIPEITTSINVELAVETRIKGVEGEEFGIFEPERLERIKNLATTTEEVAIESKDLGFELEDISHGCKCYFECGGCVIPICGGSCEWVTFSEDVYNEETGEWETVTWEECIDNCCGIRCTSDPCCEVRSQIDANKAENRENIRELQELRRKLGKETIDLEIEVDKLEKALKIMKEYGLWGVLSRDNFISLKDYYTRHNWELKKIRYWDEIQTLLPFSFADFYCPVGGTRLAYTPEEGEIPPEELEKASEEFEEYLAKGGEFEVIVSCSKPIPFGEIIDKGLVIANNLISKMKEFSILQKRVIEAIDDLHKLVSECTSDRCSPVCDCFCCEADCACTPCWCVGEACPWGAIHNAATEIENIQKQITQKRKEIEEIIDENIPSYLNNEFQRMAERFHYCIAVPEEIEPGWLLLDCERAILTISPDQKIFEKMEECECKYKPHWYSGTPKCIEDFPELSEYYLEMCPSGCCFLEKCYEYNFFCCRIKD